MKNLLNRIFKYPLVILILGFIAVWAIVDIATPTREFSEIENKYLATMPKLSYKTLVNGEFAKKYETYVTDQFIGRDFWINLKSLSETILLKVENNNIVYGADGQMFSKFYKFDIEQLRNNLSYIDSFSSSCKSDVSVMIVPSAFYPLVDKVPSSLPSVDENYYIKRINSFLSDNDNTTVINVKDILTANSDKYIYYRTDHHWTTYGAYLASTLFSSAKGFKPIDYNLRQKVEVDGFLGTHYSKSKALFAKPDTIEYFDYDNIKLTVDGVEHDSLYNYEMFNKRDKYAAFIYGNGARTEIETEENPRKMSTLLVIGDSYGDSLVPLLCDAYKTITVIDPRYYNGDYSEFTNGEYSDILIIYGFENLTSETSIAKLLPDN